jgi:hypothetical protein
MGRKVVMVWHLHIVALQLLVEVAVAVRVIFPQPVAPVVQAVVAVPMGLTLVEQALQVKALQGVRGLRQLVTTLAVAVEQMLLVQMPHTILLVVLGAPENNGLIVLIMLVAVVALHKERRLGQPQVVLEVEGKAILRVIKRHVRRVRQTLAAAEVVQTIQAQTGVQA